ncbi:unnamed protein product (macronuclear) [Paramecium tetraurelia]|uniref:Uncharacterized protein n=1 Tax=Paramecium tetraurelia TaxID=5888 RepID=A0EEH2_PARTE|nr:uncharacterized protein GSPATT00026035001 [Paramecium tetraurelia]CAK93699.1 unnamed protein product [Paramecium tetraurelia]|eukprot:XP_001461086.1 hypothetical protein (macronuclear) [Paramecium tetraurelia strain d4-2]
MLNQVDDQSFKKMIDQTSPQSTTTQKLCLRLGYDPNDLIYKSISTLYIRSIEQFPSVSPEVQMMRYNHYKNRVMRIINEIQTNKQRHKLGDQSLKQITFNQQENNISNISEESVVIQEKKEKKGLSREKILQNLIYQQLQEEKKNVEYLQKQNQKLQNHQNIQLRKSETSFSKLRVRDGNKNKSTEQTDEFEQRNLYLITCIENESRIQEQLQGRFLKKHFKHDNYTERAHEKRKQQENQFQQTITERLNKLQLKETQAQTKVELYKKDMKNYFAQKNSQIIFKQEKKSQIMQFEQQQYIKQQCEKMKKFQENKSQLILDEKKKINERKEKYIKMLRKCKESNYEQQNKHQEGFSNTYQQLLKKQEQVISNKEKLLEQKSLILKDKLQLNLEDVEFNRAHAQRIKLNTQIKQNNNKDAKSQQSSLTSDTWKLKSQLTQKESENSLWEKAKQAASLFKDPIYYEQYVEQQQLVLLKKKKSLDQKFASAASIIKEILPKHEAENLLMPSELKNFLEQQSRIKTQK